eukprot:1369770-Prymnesium_polylepis.1
MSLLSHHSLKSPSCSSAWRNPAIALVCCGVNPFSASHAGTKRLSASARMPTDVPWLACSAGAVAEPGGELVPGNTAATAAGGAAVVANAAAEEESAVAGACAAATGAGDSVTSAVVGVGAGLAIGVSGVARD